MRRYISLFLALCLVLVVHTSSVAAEASLEALRGSTNANAYQPTTDNPQNNVSSNLQTTGSGLQPTSGQTNLSQEALTGQSNLIVVGTQGNVVNSNTTSVPKASESKKTPWLLIATVLGVGVLLVGWLIRRPGPKTIAQEVVATETAAPEKPAQQPAAPKKKSTKKSPAKRSNKKRKRKK